MRILLDMDGVIADFVGGALDRFEARLDGREVVFCNGTRHPWPPGEYEVNKVLGVDAYYFWERLNHPGFWSGLPAYLWLGELMEALQGHEVFVCSMPTISGGRRCLSEKLFWLQRHVPELANRYVFATHKFLCARPDTLLIDDSDIQCHAFRLANGRACLFPQIWNAGHNLDSRNFVKEHLHGYIH